MKTATHKFALILTASFGLFVASAPAGSLTPPGAPAPTMKTLDEVEARTPIRAADLPLDITTSGSYYLVGNITFPTTSVSGIIIHSSGVTIDLNGFTLAGPGSGTGAGEIGIVTVANVEGDVTIRNGTIRGWGGDGINVDPGSAITIKNVTAFDNGGTGIEVAEGMVLNCRAENNGGSGITITAGMAVGNYCANNASRGINGGDGVLIKDNICNENATGIAVEISDGAVVIGNVCQGNTGSGILSNLSSSSNRIESNTVSNNGTGISLGGDSIAVKNMLHGNTTAIDTTGGGVAGPIINLTGSSTINSEHPWANFVY